MGDEKLAELVGELIRQVSAFPDNCIIAEYQTKLALNRLPDYIVAQTIEEIVR